MPNENYQSLIVLLDAPQLLAALALEALASLLDSLSQLSIEQIAWRRNGERVALPQLFNFINASFICELYDQFTIRK
jgi:hypothetical protein